MTSDYWTARNFRYCHRFPIEIRDADDHAEAIDYYLCQDPSKLAQLLEGKEVIVHTFILQGKNRSAIKLKH